MDESHTCIDYIKEQETEETWECVCCKIHEIQLELRTNHYHVWDRYQLACGHYAHPRCYRTWSHKNACVGCPMCGEKEETDENRYCVLCKNWGHLTTECPVYRMTVHHRVNMRYRQLSLDTD